MASDQVRFSCLTLGAALVVLVTSCTSSKLHAALAQPEMAGIRERLETSGATVKWATLEPGIDAGVVVDPEGRIVVLISDRLMNEPVEVIKQHIAHEEVHVSRPPLGQDSFEEERDAYVQEAEIWREVKQALQNVQCDKVETMVFGPDGKRRSDAEIRKVLEKSGY